MTPRENEETQEYVLTFEREDGSQTWATQYGTDHEDALRRYVDGHPDVQELYRRIFVRPSAWRFWEVLVFEIRPGAAAAHVYELVQMGSDGRAGLPGERGAARRQRRPGGPFPG